MASGKSFLFLGPELGEKAEALEAQRKKSPQAEETSFYAGEISASEMAAHIRNGSLFASERRFIIKNAEALKKADAEILAPCIENPGGDTAIILLSDATKIEKKIEDAAQNKTIFWEIPESRKADRVASYFRAEGCKIDAEGIAAILELVENNTEALRRESVRLALFFGKEKTITAADVEEWLSHNREESAFTLFAAVARGSLVQSLDILRRLLGANQHYREIFGGFVWCIRRLSQYLALKKAGNASDFELRKIGLGAPKIRQDYIEAERRGMNPEKALSLVAECEYRLGFYGAAFEEILLDELMVKLAA
jgi:DNA polymerase-3 subunit delta